MSDEKVFEIRKQDLPNYLVSFVCRSFWYYNDTPFQRRWSFDVSENKLIPYDRNKTPYVIFEVEKGEPREEGYEKFVQNKRTIKVTLENEKEVEEHSFEIVFDVKKVNTYNFAEKRCWAIAFKEQKKLQKQYKDKIVTAFKYNARKVKYDWWGLAVFDKRDLENICDILWSYIVSFAGIETAPIPPQIEEEIEVEEAFAGWTEPTTTMMTQSQPQEKVTSVTPPQREREEEVKLDRKELERIALAQGFIKKYLICFNLPTEYRNCITKFTKENGKIIETRELTVDPKTYRTLRKRFYNLLHDIAFKSLPGWILREGEDITVLNDVIAKLNKLAGTQRAVYIVESYFPRETLVEWLSQYIAERKMSIKEVQKKINEVQKESKEYKRLKKQLQRFIEELNKLEEEFKYLKGE